MSQLLIPDLDEATLTRLRERAALHGRTVESEAKTVLVKALTNDPWAAADSLFDELSASGRSFSDSVELLREDRER